jgi:type II secretory pathway pseudopilin PulG
MAPATTSPTSAACSRRRRRAAGGFTLVELLVVIGIIVLILGLAAPMITRAWRAGERAATYSDLQAVATALEAYKQDFGDYPRVTDKNTGAAILFKALVAPGKAAGPYAQAAGGSQPFLAGDAAAQGNTEYVCFVDTTDPPPSTRAWVAFSFVDGLDGPGFRTRTGGAPKPAYLDPGKFAGARSRMPGALRDRYSHAILYFPASAARPNVHVVGQNNVPGYVHSDPNGGDSKFSMYDADDNLGAFGRAGVTTDALRRLRIMLGDSNTNGIIDPGETAFTGPYVLWSCGPDELYGPDQDMATANNILDSKDAAKCDDITNFRQ